MKTITKRETEVLHMIAFEHTMKEIASLLFISMETVKTHRKHLYEKLKARNTAGLVRRAYELEILELNVQAA